MTPQQLLEFEEMKTTLNSIVSVENVPFIENIKRRGAQGMTADGETAASSVTQAVNEGGVATYSVASEPDTKLKVILADGTVLFLAAYTS